MSAFDLFPFDVQDQVLERLHVLERIRFRSEFLTSSSSLNSRPEYKEKVERDHLIGLLIVIRMREVQSPLLQRTAEASTDAILMALSKLHPKDPTLEDVTVHLYLFETYADREAE